MYIWHFCQALRKNSSRSVFCTQCNYWLISTRFQATLPIQSHSRTIWEAKGEIRMSWNGSQTENISLKNYRYHEKLAKFETGKCFPRQACPHSSETIRLLSDQVLEIPLIEALYNRTITTWNKQYSDGISQMYMLFYRKPLYKKVALEGAKCREAFSTTCTHQSWNMKL